MRYVRTEAPTDQPVSLSEAMRQIRLGDDFTWSDHVALYIAAAVDHLDGHTGVLGRCLEPQEWRLEASGPGRDGRLAIDLPPILEILEIVTIHNGEASIWSQDEWRADFEGERAYILPEDGYSWPSLDRRADAVQVTFSAGYERTGSATAVPAPIRQAILLLVAHYFTAAEAAGDGAREIPFGVSALTAPYRVIRL